MGTSDIIVMILIITTIIITTISKVNITILIIIIKLPPERPKAKVLISKAPEDPLGPEMFNLDHNRNHQYSPYHHHIPYQVNSPT